MKVFFALVFFVALIVNTPTSADEQPATITPLQLLQVSAKMINSGDKKQVFAAKALLIQAGTMTPQEYEIERGFLLAQIFIMEGKIDYAIDIYRQILNINPKLPRIRYELALLYMRQESWYKADHHLRFAMAEELPPEIDKRMRYLRFVVRQNKNWNFWFNFNLTKDDNINNASGEAEECISIWGLILCRDLPQQEKALVTNIGFGGNYAYKFNQNWQLKSDAAVFIKEHNKKKYDKYDDTYLSFSTGPNYVYTNGNVWLSAVGIKRYVGHEPYNYGIGAKIDTNYDFTYQWSGGITAKLTERKYDLYNILDGYNTDISSRIYYTIDSSKYLAFMAWYSDTKTREPLYDNINLRYAIGYGMSLPLGFNIYIEPSLLQIKYKESRYIVKDFQFMPVKEKTDEYSYNVSLSNDKLALFNFTPQLNFTYMERKSSVPQQEYKGSSVSITLVERF